MAAIDWNAAITALTTGGLPCPGGGRRILELAASLAAGIPVDLRDTVTGIDDHNAALLATAIQQLPDANRKQPVNQPDCRGTSVI